MEKGYLIKDFRKRVLEKKADVSDKEFFLSHHCYLYLENLIEAICKLYNNKIKLMLDWSNDDYIARATDRYQLMINCNNKFFNSCTTRVDKLIILKALALHECGHLLFTDYHLLKSTKKVFLDNRKLFPEPKCEEYKEWLTDAASFDSSSLTEWFAVWRRLENSLEDGFIEYQILQKIPGEGQCLYSLRNMQYDDFEPYKVMKNNGLTDSQILFNLILSLSKYGTVKMDKDDSAETTIAALLDNFDLIQKTVHTVKSYDRVKLINEVFCKLYKFMKEEKERDEQSNQNSDSEEQGTADSENQTSNNDSDDDSSDNPDNNSDNDNGSNDSSNSDNSDNVDEPNESNNSDNTNYDSDDDFDNNNNDMDSNSDSNDNFSSEESDNPLPSPSSLLDGSPEDMNDDIDTGCGSVLNDKNIDQSPVPPARNNEEKLNSMTQGNEQTAAIPSPQDMRLCNSLEEEIAAEAIKQEAEEELAKSLKEEAESFDFGPINNREIEIIRNMPSERAYDVFEKDMEQISFLVKKTVSEIQDKIKDQQQGGKINGLYLGRQLDSHSLYRYDLRVLCKNDLPEDIPDMAIGILIDASFSMNGKNIEYARKTALLLYEFGQRLNIPVMVYSHNVYGNVKMTALADYNSVDGNDKYRICDISVSGCNRDGMALRFCSEKLSKRPEQNKIMFVLSDGLPSDYDSEALGKQDIREVLLDYSKKNVRYITFGLGNEQARIEDLYTQGMSPKVAAQFIKIDAPEMLPKEIVRCIKSLIKTI